MFKTLTAFTVLLILIGVQDAAAKPRQLASGVQWFAVDGDRYAAWAKEDADTITVLDTRTHKRRHASKPTHCRGGESGRAMVGGWLLLLCRSGERLLDVRSGRFKRLPEGFDGWKYLGERFVQGSADAGRVDVYLNRRTGGVRRFRERSDHRVRDLDDPKLRLVCGPPGYLDNFARFYDARYVVSQPSGDEALVLRRRCKAKGRVIGRGDFLGGAELSEPFVAAGWVSWAAGGEAHAENLKTRKRRHWHVPNYERGVGFVQVGQARNTIFFAPAQTDDGFSAPVITSFDVFEAPLSAKASG